MSINIFHSIISMVQYSSYSSFIIIFIVMIESILIKFTSLAYAVFSLLIAFTMSTKMICFNQLLFVTITKDLHQ
jgi:hypothetical protein